MTILQSTNWRPISNNMGGQLGPLRQILMHQQVGNGSLWGFFNNPASQVSAHFWVGKDGTGEQYVDTSRVAWHAREANGVCLGVEFEGFPDEPITQPQIDRMGLMLAELVRTDGLVLQEANSQAQYGFGFHRLWVLTACPSDLRLSARPAMIAAASGPPPKPKPQGGDMIASTPTGNGYWICKPDGSIFTFGDANYLGGTNPGSKTPMPAGLTATGFAAHPSAQGYWIESSDGGVYAFGAAGYHGGANTP